MEALRNDQKAAALLMLVIAVQSLRPLPQLISVQALKCNKLLGARCLSGQFSEAQDDIGPNGQFFSLDEKEELEDMQEGAIAMLFFGCMLTCTCMWQCCINWEAWKPKVRSCHVYIASSLHTKQPTGFLKACKITHKLRMSDHVACRASDTEPFITRSAKCFHVS